MGKKRKGKQLHHLGKGLKTDGHTSFYGEPNTNLDTYRKQDGVFRKRRKFGNDGFAVKDYDMPDEHKKWVHVHQISRERGRDPNGVKPNKKEYREINKAKKKRRFWRND